MSIDERASLVFWRFISWFSIFWLRLWIRRRKRFWHGMNGHSICNYEWPSLALIATFCGVLRWLEVSLPHSEGNFTPQSTAMYTSCHKNWSKSHLWCYLQAWHEVAALIVPSTVSITSYILFCKPKPRHVPQVYAPTWQINEWPPTR